MSTYMHKKEIAYCGIDEGFKGGQAEALEKPRGNKAVIALSSPFPDPVCIRLVGTSPSPGRGDYHDDRSQNKQMAFTPDSSGRYAEYPSNANAAKVVSC